MEQIDWNSPVITDKGKEVRILATDVGGDFPVLGIIGETVHSWALDGTPKRKYTPNVQNVQLRDKYYVVITSTGCYESDVEVNSDGIIACVIVYPKGKQAEFVYKYGRKVDDVLTPYDAPKQEGNLVGGFMKGVHISKSREDFDTTTKTFDPQGLEDIL